MEFSIWCPVHKATIVHDEWRDDYKVRGVEGNSTDLVIEIQPGMWCPVDRFDNPNSECYDKWQLRPHTTLVA